MSIAQKKQNLALQSQTLDNASWAKTGCTISSDVIANPVNGALTADAIVEDGTNGTHNISQTSSQKIIGALYTSSFYVKPSTRTWCLMSISGGGVYQNFDLSGAGALGVSTGNPINPTIVALPGGWYRISMSMVASVASLLCSLYGATGDGVPAVTYVGSNGATALYAFGGQTVQANHPGPYTPTTTVAVNTGNIRNIANVGQYRLEELTMGDEGFTAANYARSAVGQLMPGDVGGFFSFVAVHVLALPTANQHLFNSSAPGAARGWGLYGGASNLLTFAVNTAGTAIISNTSPLVGGDVGKIILYGFVYDPGAGQIKAYRAAAAVTPIACVGYKVPTAADRSAIGVDFSAGQPGVFARIVGALYGTGIPTAANILAHYNSCKRENRMVTMPGSVTNVNRWEARDYTPVAAGSWVDNIGGMILTQTGTLTRVPFAPKWE